MVSRECVHECALYMHVSYQNETVKMKFDCYFLETKSRRYTKLPLYNSVRFDNYMHRYSSKNGDTQQYPQEGIKIS